MHSCTCVSQECIHILEHNTCSWECSYVACWVECYGLPNLSHQEHACVPRNMYSFLWVCVSTHPIFTLLSTNFVHSHLTIDHYRSFQWSMIDRSLFFAREFDQGSLFNWNLVLRSIMIGLHLVIVLHVVQASKKYSQLTIYPHTHTQTHTRGFTQMHS